MSDCDHTNNGEFRGMKRMGMTDDLEKIVFRCPVCNALARIPRCLGTTRYGTRCRQPQPCRAHP